MQTPVILITVGISFLAVIATVYFLLLKRIRAEFGGRVKMSAMIQSLTDGVALFDRDRRVIIINDSMARMTGLPREGFYIGELTALFKSEVDIDKKLDEALGAGRTTHIGEASIVNFTYEIFIEPLVSGKKVLGGAVIIRDITTFKDLAVAKALIDQEKMKYETLLEAIGDGVVAIDREWTIIAWNKAAGVISGFSREEAVGRPFREVVKFVRQYDRAESITFIEEAMVKGEIRPMGEHMLLITKSGKEIPVGDSASPILSSGKVVGAIIIFRDASREKEAQSLKSDFAYASHQLRTPVTKAAWNIETALETKDREELQKYLLETADSIKSVAKLAEHLIDVSALDQGRIFPNLKGERLSSLIDDAVKKIIPKARAREIDIKISPVPPSAEIFTDANLASRIFAEILDNAVIYSPDKSFIEINTSIGGDNIIFEIKDVGIGIIGSEQPLIFTKFFRGSNFDTGKIPGAGLGLFIAQEYVRILRGNIWFRSEENKGTAFYVSIPVNR